MKEARRLQLISVRIVQLLGKYGGMATGKAFMRLVGIDCGKFRSPVKNLTDKMYEDFVKDVEQLKVADLLSKKQ
jgi:N-acetylneuraminate lyase